MPLVTQSAAWAALQAHADAIADVRIDGLFDADPSRPQALSAEGAGLFLDYSKQHVDAEAMRLLFDLARQQDLAGWQQRLFGGEHVNMTEDRAALHMALRAAPGDVFLECGQNVVPAVHAVIARMDTFAKAVRGGHWLGASGERITDVVNIGIGGSDLGPRMVCDVLAPEIDGPRPHFVSNVDGADLHAVLQSLNPATTMFVVASKTFTTQETLSNALHARAWTVATLGEAAVSSHFVAVSTARAEVEAFGIDVDNMFEFWDWVGGRYSVWSAIGLPIVLALGPERFAALHAGARAMDHHFKDAPFDSNLPVLMGLLTIWNQHFFGATSHVLAPYAQRLNLFSNWVQQLAMESNGKRVTRGGEIVDYPTTPALWGNVGTNAQHAYFQMLHQGPALHVIDFIAPVAFDHPYPDMHRKLLANCFAQSAALMRGKSAETVRAELTAKGFTGEALEAAIPHRVFPGNRPTNTLLLPRLDAFSLGALLALYEYRTFVLSVIWDINPFDQWGVELGKQLAKRILDPDMAQSMDPSTQALMQRAAIWESTPSS